FNTRSESNVTSTVSIGENPVPTTCVTLFGGPTAGRSCSSVDDAATAGCATAAITATDHTKPRALSRARRTERMAPPSRPPRAVHAGHGRRFTVCPVPAAVNGMHLLAAEAREAPHCPRGGPKSDQSIRCGFADPDLPTTMRALRKIAPRAG